MEEKLIKALTKARYDCEIDLNDNIWCAIIAQNKKTVRIKLWFFSGAVFTSLVLLVPMSVVFSRNLANSGFYEYFSLMFSDMKSVTSLWREFGLLLADSLPIMNIVTLMILIFVFLWSLRYIMKQVMFKAQLSLSY
jgi:hypothetical protein